MKYGYGKIFVPELLVYWRSIDSFHATLRENFKY